MSGFGTTWQHPSRSASGLRPCRELLVLCNRLGHAGKTLLARLLQEAGVEVVEFTAEHWTVAADVFIAYGKDGTAPVSTSANA